MESVCLYYIVQFLEFYPEKIKTTKLAPPNLHVMVKSLECTGCYECHRDTFYPNSSNENHAHKNRKKVILN